MNLWEKTIAELRTSVPAYDFKHWIRPILCKQVDTEACEIVLTVPDESHERWVEENFMGQIRDTLAKITPDAYSIRFASPISAVPRVANATDRARSKVRVLPELVDRYRFDAFVDGPNSQFAVTAAEAVARRPGRQYNPLFLYGGVGLGKTHLLHAIGHAVLDRDPHKIVRYVTSETYVNDLIGAIRTDRMDAFRRRYRDNCDVLLIDDIQFIAGKDRTQEEFFHMFNTLHSSHKQIVMTCDQVPRSIPDMEDRLRSRLEWGLLADIKPPGFETRVAILKQKAELDGVPLPDDVAMLLARHVNHNVRELEGALMRLAAAAHIFRNTITLEMAREALGDLIQEEVRSTSTEAIMKTVARDFRVTIADLKGPRRHRTIIVPRQVAMYLIRELTEASLPQIGAAFGGRDHTTVINGLKRIDALKKADPELDARITRLRRQLVG